MPNSASLAIAPREKDSIMSLNQKYTWQDFLKENPAHKEKGTKRTTPEGKKAFGSAYKAHIKKYLAERSKNIDEQIKRAEKRRDERVAKLRDYQKAKKLPLARRQQERVGRAGAAIGSLKRQKDRTKLLQKTFK